MPGPLPRTEAGEVVSFTDPEDLPSEAREMLREQGLASGVILPMASDDNAIAALLLLSRARREWCPEILERLRLVAAVISQALARRAGQTALSTALGELRQVRERDQGERRREARSIGSSRMIVAESPRTREALAQVEQVAPSPATVLLLGETGAGKEVFAQAIHDLSPRHRKPMVVVNCAAIPTALLESELFGRERGAYTGALSRQIGRFEAADQSTLFLDEIGDLPADMQIKLLRVLQDHVIERLGSVQPIKVDVRIIAATHRDLEKAVQTGAFREDLYYRLNVFPIKVPPLRDRPEDIPGLVWAFVDEFSKACGKTIESVSRESMEALQNYAWPGNIRELRNAVERAMILAAGRQLVIQVPRSPTGVLTQTPMTLDRLEAEHIRRTLEATDWRIRGRGGAAERLGLKPTTLESRMARLGIVRPARGTPPND